jgi:NAD+ synthase
MKNEYTQRQSEISEALKVAKHFNVSTEIERRTAFLCDYLMETQRRSYVLGISGGVDSLSAALLAQAAVLRARELGHDTRFYAMRLPYGMQADEADAQRSLH